MTHPRPPIPDSRRYGIEPYYGPVSDRMARAGKLLTYLAQDFRRHGTAFPPLLWRVLHDLEIDARDEGVFTCLDRKLKAYEEAQDDQA